MYCLAMNCDENRSCFGRAAACEGLLEVGRLGWIGCRYHLHNCADLTCL